MRSRILGAATALVLGFLLVTNPLVADAAKQVTIDLERAPRGTHLVSSPGDLYVLVDPLNSGSDQAYFTVEFGR